MKISDDIENFIVEQMGEDIVLDFSRNALADYFGCVPSQINYVLSTRFNLAKGYTIESQKGGGGYIRLIKIKLDKNSYINHLLTEAIGNEIDYYSYVAILKEMERQNLIDKNQEKVLEYAGCSKSLASPFKMENIVRANMLKTLLTNILKEQK